MKTQKKLIERLMKQLGETPVKCNKCDEIVIAVQKSEEGGMEGMCGCLRQDLMVVVGSIDLKDIAEQMALENLDTKGMKVN